MENISNVVEAIVFSSGQPILKKDLCDKIPELTTAELNKIVKQLQKKYCDESGILLVEFNGKLQFTSNTRYGDIVADILTPLKEKSLTKTLLEVLSTIAYKQPITKLEIEDMRGGVNSEYAITGLLKAGLIEVVGRKKAVGNPMLYGTTDEFLKKFEISSLEELPDLVEVMEKIQLIYAPPQDTLFSTRSLIGENGEEVEIAEGIAAELEDEFDEELPEFLEGESFKVFD